MVIIYSIIGILVAFIVLFGVYNYIRQGPYLGDLKDDPHFKNYTPEDFYATEIEWEEALKAEVVSPKRAKYKVFGNSLGNEDKNFIKDVFNVKCPICESANLSGKILVVYYKCNPAPLVGFGGLLCICSVHRNQIRFFETEVY